MNPNRNSNLPDGRLSRSGLACSGACGAGGGPDAHGGLRVPMSRPPADRRRVLHLVPPSNGSGPGHRAEGPGMPGLPSPHRPRHDPRRPACAVVGLGVFPEGEGARLADAGAGACPPPCGSRPEPCQGRARGRRAAVLLRPERRPAAHRRLVLTHTTFWAEMSGAAAARRRAGRSPVRGRPALWPTGERRCDVSEPRATGWVRRSAGLHGDTGTARCPLLFGRDGTRPVDLPAGAVLATVVPDGGRPAATGGGGLQSGPRPA